MVQMEITETSKNSPRMVVIPKALLAIRKNMGEVKVPIRKPLFANAKALVACSFGVVCVTLYDQNG